MVLLACTILCLECWLIGIVVVGRARVAAFGTVENPKCALINETQCSGWPDYGATNHSIKLGYKQWVTFQNANRTH